MSDFPALEAMGIQNPHEISRFEMFTTNQTDILRIVYDRKKGSILPVSRRYKFAQIKKSTMVDSGTRRTEVLYESSAEFRNALTELERLTNKKKSAKVDHDMIVEQLRLLQEDVASRTAYIQKLLDS